MPRTLVVVARYDASEFAQVWDNQQALPSLFVGWLAAKTAHDFTLRYSRFTLLNSVNLAKAILGWPDGDGGRGSNQYELHLDITLDLT